MLLLLKQLSILSLIAGAGLGVIATIPFLFWVCILLAMFWISAFIIVYLKKNDLIGIINVREGSIFGALIGFVAFIAFSVAFIPVSSIIGLIFKSYSLDVLSFFMKDFGSFVVLILLIISTAALAGLFNGFTGLCTAYAYELITGIKKENNENNSVDFTIE
jgi:hypothetical protein